MAQPLNFPSEIKWLFLFHKGENMSNTKKKYGVRISVLEYGYYEVEAGSKEEAEAKAEEKIAEGNVCWGDFEITDSTAEKVRREKVRDGGDR